MKHRFLLPVLLAAWTVAGCASPSSRIERNPELYNALTPDQQQRVREGRIDLGFSPDMVRLAWGDPSRVALRKTETTQQEIWSYRALEPDGFAYRYPYAGYYPPYGWCDDQFPYYGFPERATTYEWGRVVFTGGAVTEIQHIDEP